MIIYYDCVCAFLYLFSLSTSLKSGFFPLILFVRFTFVRSNHPFL